MDTEMFSMLLIRVYLYRKIKRELLSIIFLRVAENTSVGIIALASRFFYVSTYK